MKTTMKQIEFQAFGEPEVLVERDANIPQPGPGEVLVRVTAVGVNFSDVLRRRNTYFMPTPLPFVLGTEAVGVVEDLGPELNSPLQVGDRVLAILPQGGGYAEYACTPAHFCVPLNDHINDSSATALFVQGTTAQLMIATLAGDLSDKVVMIHAASGGVGSLLVQLAQLNGATVIAAAGSKAKANLAMQHGAALAVDYSQPNWNREVMNFTAGKGVDVLFEMVGGEVFNAGCRAVTPGGKVILYGCASGVQGTLAPEFFVDHNIALLGFNLAHHIQHKFMLWQQALGAMMQLVAERKVQISTPHVFPLAEAAKAHAQMESRRTTGKVILVP